jgi:hypothetical protein
MSCTIRISENEVSFKEITVNGKKHTQTIETLTEVVLVPFGVPIHEFCEEVEHICKDYYIEYSDGGFRGEMEGSSLLKLIKKYNLIKLSDICDDDCYTVVISW